MEGLPKKRSISTPVSLVILLLHILLSFHGIIGFCFTLGGWRTQHNYVSLLLPLSATRRTHKKNVVDSSRDEKTSDELSVDGPRIIDQRGSEWQPNQQLRQKLMRRDDLIDELAIVKNITNRTYSQDIDLRPGQSMLRATPTDLNVSLTTEFGAPFLPFRNGSYMSDDERWSKYHVCLKAYKSQHGNVNVPQNFTVKDTKLSLGIWVRTQRQKNKEGWLSEDREQMLNELGFDWDPLNSTWMEKFHALQQYKQSNGHCRVPIQYDADPSLGLWVSNQRHSMKENCVSEEREQLLNELGFEWDIYNSMWVEKFHELQKFRQINGHCSVPNVYDANPSLGRWVSKQRLDKKKNRLSEKREQMLNELGFEWKFNKPWMVQFDALKQFKRSNGHCRVPRHYDADPSLDDWVYTQRHYKKNNRLSEDREQMLNELGFDWEVSKPWVEQFYALQLFRQSNGHCLVPLVYDADPSFGLWVRKQRQDKKKKQLSEDREQLLQELGFEWEINKPWMDQFDALKQFKRSNGHCRVPRHYDADPSLGCWVHTQRRDKKNNRLSEDREQMLDELGFEWVLRRKREENKDME